MTHLLRKESVFLFPFYDRIEPPRVTRGNLFRPDEENNHRPPEQEDEKDEKLFYQFRVHIASLQRPFKKLPFLVK